VRSLNKKNLMYSTGWNESGIGLDEDHHQTTLQYASSSNSTTLRKNDERNAKETVVRCINWSFGGRLAVGWLKMPEMNLTDVKLMDQVSSYEIDGHEIDEYEIGGQDIISFENNYITMQCAFF